MRDARREEQAAGRGGAGRAARRGGGLALGLVATYLLVLRGLVLGSEAAGLNLGAVRLGQADGWVHLSFVLLTLVSSLCFELLALLALCAVVRRGRWGRALARAGLVGLLWGNLAGTQAFLVLHTYAKGFQLVGQSVPEFVRMAVGLVGPAALLGLAVPPVLAALFGRDGSLERAPAPTRTLGALAALGLVAAASVTRLVARPLSTPTAGHSPFTLAMVANLPDGLSSAPRGQVRTADWAPPRGLAPAWQGLAAAPRDLNVVVVVLESVRARDFWPSPSATPMPRLAALAPHAAVFTRAYAHEPLSLKGFEALLYGIYPPPFWETAAVRWPDLALETVGQRWERLGLRTAFLSYGEVGFLGTRDFLQAHGFGHVADGETLRTLDPEPEDRTLVKALAQFLDRRVRPGERFGAILWPHHTHLPYRLPRGLQRHPDSSYAAYRDAIGYLDVVIGDVVDLLAARGLSERTVLVLVADHGEAFGEHPDGGYAHGDRLYESSVHIPLVFVNPRLFHGERDVRVVQQKDVAATLAWLAGADAPTLNAGASVFHERPSETAYLLSHMDAGNLRGALVDGRLKYLYTAPVGLAGPQERLYDVVADPEEVRDLRAERPEAAEALRARFFGWLHHWGERWGQVEQQGASQDAAALRRVLLGTGTTAAAPAP